MPCNFRLATLAALWTLLSVVALAGTLQSFQFQARDYPGSRNRDYQVYLPAGLAQPAPMVMALHGCRQDSGDVMRDWGLRAAADRHGFILVTPYITSYDGLRTQNCWGFWFDAHRHQGRGEPEDLHRIGLEVEGRFPVDPKRRFLTGLSSGGAISVVAAITHNEYWSAVATAAGLPYGEDPASVSYSCPGFASLHPLDRVVREMRTELDHPHAIPLLVLQNEKDCTVIAAAASRLRDAHLKLFGSVGHDTPARTLTAQKPCAPVYGDDDYGCLHSVYHADGQGTGPSLVETVFYRGPLRTPNTADTDHGHYWIGGSEGKNGKWAMRDGPSYPDIVWDFFSRHPRAAQPPTIALLGHNPLHIALGQAFIDPGATASDSEDGKLPVTADCSQVDSSRVGHYTCSYQARDSDANQVGISREVRIFDPALACKSATASPALHLASGNAVPGGLFSMRALANGDQQDIGFAWDVWFSVTLYEGEPGKWYARPPTACALRAGGTTGT
ncbi:PHB depolymerase family esterase [Chitinimonas arctica]|uniref:PHB depolymerase family esterase n=1 Tax=Chitinimonas arctica TaxID=2594795 RepID=A0A516SA12_9NEIS|nr:PHB depolymerase family esterase [Chitinimonas arctica]QDQ24989.1 PHB depolymerase family esterase [Chitinimonas arctica]